MNTFKSYFIFTKSQRKNILILIGCIFLLQFLYFYLDFNLRKKEPINIHTHEIASLQAQIDSLREVEIQNRAPKIYPFNPNFISDYKGYILGMSPEEIDRLHDFRDQDAWINSAIQFQEVTHISDSLLEVLYPYFQFPEWTKNATVKKEFLPGRNEKKFSEKGDLNQVNAEDLQKIYGIGKVLSQRIVQYREKINGFQIDEQLEDVYGLEPDVVKNILAAYSVKEVKPRIQFNINTVSASDLSTIPGLNFSIAKEIIDYRLLHEGFKSMETLKEVKGFPVQKYNRIALYLTLD